MASHIEEFAGKLAPTGVKHQLAAIQRLFDWLVVGQVLP